MNIVPLNSQPGSSPASPAARLRRANAGDLPAINAIIEQAIATWLVSPRVLRLSLPLYRYTEIDLAHLDLVVAEGSEILGVSALESAADDHAVLLHGLYVHPQLQRRGVGRQLLRAAEDIARLQGRGMRVRSRPESIGFFESSGYQRLPQVDLGNDYPWLLWKSLADKDSSAA
ncbi:MAG: GNAT family N-acetyltransferase [Gammaproteobacteria bacterium]|nr:GNAT family N-acetyltransferase [Gammaproteobacteria bacterium]